MMEIKTRHIAPLITFRILFGLVMLLSVLRFMYKGWIYEQYVQPTFYFTYSGFEWVKPLGETGMYALFILMALAATCITVGFYYRLFSILFFLSFTYVELIDKTNYLNHYYFVSIIGFLLIFVPAHRYFSLDVWRKPELESTHVPWWTIDLFKLQLALVYCFAGLAKLNYDWMVNALPLAIWLPPLYDTPLIGWLFKYSWVHYAFSWGGALYDLTIPFLLLIPFTRPLAYLAVIVFHIITATLFPIGMFPYIMMAATLIFFSEEFHQKILAFLRGILGIRPRKIVEKVYQYRFPKLVKKLLIAHFIVQLLLPLRFLTYPDPGNIWWHEKGYRFSWRVMLMEKTGICTFTVVEPSTGKKWEVHHPDYLTKNQEKMMSTQPDMMQQYAAYLTTHYAQWGIIEPEVESECFVSLNGRRSKALAR